MVKDFFYSTVHFAKKNNSLCNSRKFQRSRFSRMRYAAGFVLLLYAFGAYGQPFQRQVLYETSTVKCFKVACDVEVISLSALDMVCLETKPAVIRQKEFVLEKDWLTISYVYPKQPRYDKDYEFKMGKSVTDKWGTTLYLHNGKEYLNLPNKEINNDFLIDHETINTYGFFNDLFDPSLKICDQLTREGIPFYTWGQKLLIFHTHENEQIEVEIDFEQLYMETRTFVDKIHEFTDRTEYRRMDNWIIPAKDKRISYSELPSGIRYQITEIETYLSYLVINEKGDTLVNKENNSFEIQVSPNPAQDYITIDFSIPINDDVNVQLLDIMNKVIRENDEFVKDGTLKIDVSTLEPSMYTVLCTYRDEQAQADFLKDGIGQYSYPNPVNIDIQIIPNPTKDYITVRFPVTINEEMTVKIMDAMGNVHFYDKLYVMNNEMKIDVHYLRLGIYYIVCSNKDGVAYAKFIKL